MMTATLFSIGSEFERLGRAGEFTREMSHLALAALYLSEEGKESPSVLHIAVLLRCITALNTQPAYAWKSLPLVLGLSLLGANENPPSQVLASHLTNGSSQVRAYAFATGWIIRRHLNANELVQPLLWNVENTLGYWDESLALCRSLYRTREEFWAAAADYHPVAMPEQYSERIQAAREQLDLIESPASLLESEVLVQRLVIQHALAISRFSNSNDPS